MIERALALSYHDQLTMEDLPEQVKNPSGEVPLPSLTDDNSQILPLEEMERRYISHVLERLDGNRTMAARLLGIDRKTLYRKLKEV